MRLRLAVALLWLTMSCIAAAADPPAAHAQEDEQAKQLGAARDTLMDRHDAVGAIRILDGIIRDFEALHGKEAGRVFCARSPEEAVLYAGMGTSAGQETVVVSDIPAMAYHMKGYALIDLGRVSDAQQALLRAKALAPFNSLVTVELAYTYQVQKDWDRALATFAEAEDDAKFAPEAVRDIEKSRAIRGQGFVLIELGRLDQAEAQFRRALAMDPNDRNAKSELDYISQLRAKGRR